jgi:hypothetical protein
MRWRDRRVTVIEEAGIVTTFTPTKRFTRDEIRKIFEDAWGLKDEEFLQLPEHEQQETLDGFAAFVVKINEWLARGDGIAVYSHEYVSPGLGHKRFFPFGKSGHAQFSLDICPRCCNALEANTGGTTLLRCSHPNCSGHAGLTAEELADPPHKLPDIGNRINWRYWISGVYQGEQL